MRREGGTQPLDVLWGDRNHSPATGSLEENFYFRGYYAVVSAHDCLDIHPDFSGDRRQPFPGINANYFMLGEEMLVLFRHNLQTCIAFTDDLGRPTENFIKLEGDLDVIRADKEEIDKKRNEGKRLFKELLRMEAVNH